MSDSSVHNNFSKKDNTCEEKKKKKTHNFFFRKTFKHTSDIGLNEFVRRLIIVPLNSSKLLLFFQIQDISSLDTSSGLLNVFV